MTAEHRTQSALQARWSLCSFPTSNCLSSLQASKAGLCIYRPGVKMEEEESQGWFSWMWNWGQEAEAKPKDVKSAGGTRGDGRTPEWLGVALAACVLPAASL